MIDCPNVVWALRQRGLTPAERIVLIFLADKVNSAMVCWPALDTIAVETELGRRTVHRAVHGLSEKGLIRIEVKHRQVNHYYLLRPINGRDPDPKHTSQSAKMALKSANVAPKDEAPRVPDWQPRVPDWHPTETRAECQIGTQRSANVAPKDGFLSANVALHPPKKESPKNPPSNARDARGRASDPPGFDAFWKSYPRKAGIGAARKAFALATAKAPPSTIMAALSRATWDPNPRFIPHPATWLNREQWLDEVDDFDPVLRAAGLTPEDFDPRQDDFQRTFTRMLQ
jgi:hypothetical protein